MRPLSTFAQLQIPPRIFSTGPSKMDLRQLHCSLQNYYHLGASPSTWKVYNAGLNRYHKFCKMANRSIFPASEDTLLLFMLQKAYWPPPSKYTSQLFAAPMWLWVDTRNLQNSLPPGSSKSSKGSRNSRPSLLPKEFVA